MARKCDICGYEVVENANFCGGCSVDLREPKSPDEPEIIPISNQSHRKEENPSSKIEESEKKEVVHWCTIAATCNSHEMTFSLFLQLILILAKGDKELGFCDCAWCNQGYREMLAWFTNGTGKKKLTAQSREIVIKARGEKIDGLSFDISKFLAILKKQDDSKSAPEQEKLNPPKPASGKIVIEIEPDVLETAVFNVLTSDKGRQIISEIKSTKGPKSKKPSNKKCKHVEIPN